MPASVPASVSADALVSAIRVHADRVHDAVRRQGCGPEVALQVVEASALDLVAVARDRPAPVPELVGRWFALARERGRRAGHDDEYLPIGTGLLADDRQQELLAVGLERRDERSRVALLLRDAYDLPPETVGAALDTGPDAALALVGRARLDLLPDVFSGAAPRFGHASADEAGVARLVGAAPAPADLATARHVRTCVTCRSVLQAEEDVRRLLAGLSVVALPDEERESLLERVSGRARALLPSAAVLEQRREEEEDDEPRRLFSPLPVVLALTTAAILGLVLGVVLSRTRSVQATPVGFLPAVTAPPLTMVPVPRIPSAPAGDSQPTTRVFTLAPTSPLTTAPTTTAPTPTPPSASPSGTATPTVPGSLAAIDVSPSRGGPGSRSP